MSKSKHANSLVGKRIRLLTGERKNDVVDVLGTVYTMNMLDMYEHPGFGGTYVEGKYVTEFKDFMNSTFGFTVHPPYSGGLRLVVRSSMGPALIVVPRRNHYWVL